MIAGQRAHALLELLRATDFQHNILVKTLNGSEGSVGWLYLSAAFRGQ
jgi:hypothetical protein